MYNKFARTCSNPTLKLKRVVPFLGNKDGSAMGSLVGDKFV